MIILVVRGLKAEDVKQSPQASLIMWANDFKIMWK